MPSRRARLPENAQPYKRTPLFTETTLPDAFLQAHSTKPGAWAVIHVEEGRLLYSVPSRGHEEELTPGVLGIIEPEIQHSVRPLGKAAFFVEFWREQEASD